MFTLVDSEFWDDPYWETKTPNQKLLFLCLWTNAKRTCACIYELSLHRIAAYTNIPEEDLPALLESIKPKVTWWPNDNIIWVRNFVRRQPKSPQVLKAVAEQLDKLHHPEVIREFLDYNKGIPIPYEYPGEGIPLRERKELKEKTGKELPTARPNIFTLYEKSIGALYGNISEELKDAETQYPPEWLEDAFAEAVRQNKRNWAYISAILKRWQNEGRDSKKPNKEVALALERRTKTAEEVLREQGRDIPEALIRKPLVMPPSKGRE